LEKKQKKETETFACAPSTLFYSICCKMDVSSSTSTKELWLLQEPTQQYQSIRSIVATFVAKHYPNHVIRNFHQKGTSFLLVLEDPTTLHVKVNGKDMSLCVSKSWTLKEIIDHLNLSTCFETGPGWEIYCLSSVHDVPVNLSQLMVVCKQSSLILSDWKKTLGSVLQNFNQQCLMIVSKVFSFGQFGEGLHYQTGAYTGNRSSLQLVLSTESNIPEEKEEKQVKQETSPSTRLVSFEHAWLHVDMVRLLLFFFVV
jgi:hypothetical protein